MYQVIVMLKQMGIEIVAEEKPDTDYGSSNRGEIVAKVENKFFKVVYFVDSYGGDMSIDSVKEVKPQTVTKVEYN